MQEIYEINDKSNNIAERIADTLGNLKGKLKILKTKSADKTIIEIDEIENKLNALSSLYRKQKEFYFSLRNTLEGIADSLCEYLNNSNKYIHYDQLGAIELLLDVYIFIPDVYLLSREVHSRWGYLEKLYDIDQKIFWSQIKLMRFCTLWYSNEKEERYLAAAIELKDHILERNTIDKAKSRADDFIGRGKLNAEDFSLIGEVCFKSFRTAQAYWELAQIDVNNVKYLLEQAKCFYQQFLTYSEYLNKSDYSNYELWDDDKVSDDEVNDRLLAIDSRLSRFQSQQSRKRKRDASVVVVSALLFFGEDSPKGPESKRLKIEESKENDGDSLPKPKKVSFSDEKLRVCLIEDPIVKNQLTIRYRKIFLKKLFSSDVKLRESIYNYFLKRHGKNVAKAYKEDVEGYCGERDDGRKKQLKASFIRYFQTVLSDDFNCIDDVLSGLCETEYEAKKLLDFYPELIISVVYEAVLNKFNGDIKQEVYRAIIEYMKVHGSLTSLFDSKCIIDAEELKISAELKKLEFHESIDFKRYDEPTDSSMRCSM